ncbi:hypothetical protein ACS0TY_017223 [Phlomoides rotata]
MGFKFKYKRNDGKYIHAFCNDSLLNECDWFIKAKRVPVTAYFQNVRAKPSLGGKEVIKEMKNSYVFDIPYWKAWRTVEATKKKIFGSYDDSYDQLRWYCSAITSTNPGSVIALEHNNDTQRFEWVFITIKACMDGFKICRSMLFVDGTFMKGSAKGTLLAATTKDGDNGLFPVALAIVSAENTSNWEWFLWKLRDVITHENQFFLHI